MEVYDDYRYLTVSNVGDLVDLLVVNHRGKSHVIRDFRVDMLVRSVSTATNNFNLNRNGKTEMILRIINSTVFS